MIYHIYIYTSIYLLYIYITWYIYIYTNSSRSAPQLFSLRQGALEAVTAPEPNIRFEVPSISGADQRTWKGTGPKKSTRDGWLMILMDVDMYGYLYRYLWISTDQWDGWLWPGFLLLWISMDQYHDLWRLYKVWLPRNRPIFISEILIWIWINTWKYHLLRGWTSINPSYFDVKHRAPMVLTHQAEMPRGGDRGSQNSGDSAGCAIHPGSPSNKGTVIIWFIYIHMIKLWPTKGSIIGCNFRWFKSESKSIILFESNIMEAWYCIIWCVRSRSI